MGRPIVTRRVVNQHSPKRLPGETNALAINKLVRRTRVANFIADLATGMTQRAVALKYGVSRHTVRNELRWAQQEGFFEDADDAIRNRLIPLAIDVLERALKMHLQSGDTEAAMKILYGVRLLSNGPARSETMEQAAEEVDALSWEVFTARRLLGSTNLATDMRTKASDAINAEVVPSDSLEIS